MLPNFLEQHKMRTHWRRLTNQLMSHHKSATTHNSFSFSTLSSPLFPSLHPCFHLPKSKTKRLRLAHLLQLPTKHNHPISRCKQTHAQIVVSGLESDAFVSNFLLKAYSKAGHLGCAREVFDKMPERNLISWSSMVSAYAQCGFGEEALLVFLEFKRCCDESPEYMLSSVVRACMQLGSVEMGEQVHGEIVKSGFDQDVYVGTSLVDFYAKRGEVDGARMVFDGLLEKSAVTWTTMITCYVKSGRSETSLWLFDQMRETNVVPDRYVLSSVLSACSTLKFVKGGEQIHAYLLRRGTEMDVSVSNVLTDFYTKCGKVHTARNIFDSMVDKNVISWTTMIAGYMQNSFDRKAMKLFVEMNKLGWKPDGFACTSILTSCGSLEALEQGRQVHAYCIKGNLESDLFVQNGLIDMYAKCGCLTVARRVFDVMADHNVVSYNAIIEGYSSIEQLFEALHLFHDMRRQMFAPSLLTFVSLLGVSAALSALELSKQIHALIIKFGVLLEVFAGSALIDVYSKCSCTPDARMLFDEMTEKDIVVWNAMLFGYTQQSENEESLKLYSELQLSEEKPNDFTFAALLTAVSNLASLQHGQQLHNHIVKMGLNLEAILTSSLVDMYAKCGSFEDACKTFDSAVLRDVVSWNSMISMYAHHGEAKDALLTFERMLDEGIKPNHVSFVGVLSASSHGGFVEDGLRYFESMPRFGIEPGIEHYSCVVSLLGRAGKLYQAKEFIERMPIKPSATLWRCLLSACRMCANIELGKYAAEMAISIDPTDSGSYALLSNIFASKGMWVDVKKVRQKMDFNGVVKEAGHSWIGVKNKIHTFIARDRTHFKAELIYSVLDELVLQIKEAGYVPDTITLLLDD